MANLTHLPTPRDASDYEGERAHKIWRIECSVDAYTCGRFDRIDRSLMSGRISQAEYDVLAMAIATDADDLQDKLMREAGF